MKLTMATIFLILASVLGFYGWIYTKFDRCLENSENAFNGKEFKESLAAIDGLRQNKWYRPLQKYPRLDLLEIDKALDYQKGRILAELGKLKEAYALFDKCSSAKDEKLSFLCLYQQGNIAFYQGNTVAEKKWQTALERNFGGHDFDTQVNLELLKSQSKKAWATANAAMLTHRRNKGPYFFLRPPTQKSGPIKP